MRLLEAIVEANHRALEGDAKAGLHVADFQDSLPLLALTCIDPRLNRLFPGVLALGEDNFVWLRNAGNIIFDPTSSMTRSLALGCAVKGGKEIAIIGHTDCQVRHITQADLLQRFQTLGVPRDHLPEDLAGFFGTFTNERDNVIRSTNIVRQSPLIGPRIPVHGLLIDTATGRLEWVVNGYEALAATAPLGQNAGPSAPLPGFGQLGSFPSGELKFPDQPIGSVTTKIGGALAELGQAAAEAKEEVKKRMEESAPPVKLAPIDPPKPPPIPTKSVHTGNWSARIKR
ncbi:MAG TPA: carbonic anhydrase [Verrucomicrobiae bacterium]|jgi:carbonic anhydrase|nr:carbonic anhydrase [Verrucomicrobiae bacterium]